jgi:hypothetical protein
MPSPNTSCCSIFAACLRQSDVNKNRSLDLPGAAVVGHGENISDMPHHTSQEEASSLPKAESDEKDEDKA